MTNIWMTEGQHDLSDPEDREGGSSSSEGPLWERGRPAVLPPAERRVKTLILGAGDEAEWTEHRTEKEEKECVVSGLKTSHLKPNNYPF